MDLKGKPTQISLQFSRRLFGPDRAEIAERSNNVGPNVDYAIHGPIVARTKQPTHRLRLANEAPSVSE
jgi:hypothetical protein